MRENWLGGCVVALIILMVLAACTFGIFNKYIFGNKQWIDLKYDYNVAYVLVNDNKFERIQIKAWKDWENSDAVQVIKLDGTPIYTHLRNIKLTKEH